MPWAKRTFSPARVNVQSKLSRVLTLDSEPLKVVFSLPSQCQVFPSSVLTAGP